MMATAIPLLSALVAGCVHALEMDHMTAVTVFISRRPQPLRAFGFGVRWALGHSAAILVAGGALIALGLRPPNAIVRLLEIGVGGMLVLLGAWVIVGAWGEGRSRGRHEHSSTRPTGGLSGTVWVGAAHGLAGTAGFLALIPVTMLASPWLAGAYLALFGLGTMLAMGVYAAGAGVIIQRVGGKAPSSARALKLCAGAASIAVGIAWLLGPG